jgi:AP endonuclease-1
MSVRRSTRVSQKVVIESKEVFVATVATVATKKRTRNASLSSLSTLSGEDAPVSAEKASGKSVRKRNTKTKTEEEPKVEDYPSRVDNAWKIGAHVSAAGGVENVILNAAAVK